MHERRYSRERMPQPPVIDARKWEALERRTALVHFEKEAVMFTASWRRPSSLVPRPDGSYRRLLLVCLQVPAEQCERPFHRVRYVSLVAAEHEPFSTDDIGGVHSRTLNSVTLAVYVDAWH